MVLENEEIDRLMARKKAIQDTLAAQARNPAPSRGGGCSSGGCSSSSAAAAPRNAAPQTGAGAAPRAVVVLTLLRAAGLAAAAGVGLWALGPAL